MSLTLTNFSSSSSHIRSGSEHSAGNPNNGRTLRRSISLKTVLSCICWLFTTAIFPHSHGHSQGAEEGTRDVEGGGAEALQLQAAAAEPNNAFVVPPPPIVVGGGSTQVAATIMRNQVVPIEAESGRGPASYVSKEEHVILSNPQFIGQQVVGIWIVPTVVGVISGLIQVAVGSQTANSDQKLLLYLCFGISLATATLGIILFILSAMRWINNQRRDLIIRSIVAVALGSTFVDICVLITFGFILVQSKPLQ